MNKLNSTIDYLEKVEIELNNYYRIIQHVASKFFGWELTLDEVKDFLTIIDMADEEIKGEE